MTDKTKSIARVTTAVVLTLAPYWLSALPITFSSGLYAEHSASAWGIVAWMTICLRWGTEDLRVKAGS